MSTSLEQLKRRFPEVREFSDDDLNATLEEAAAELNADALGNLYQTAAVYLAAHKLHCTKRTKEGGAGAGPVVSQGITSAGFASAGEEDLASTLPGRMLKGLLQRRIVTGRVLR